MNATHTGAFRRALITFALAFCAALSACGGGECEVDDPTCATPTPDAHTPRDLPRNTTI